MTKKKSIVMSMAIAGLLAGGPAAAQQDADAVAEMARKAQDPLADVKAFMTDNTIAFDGGPEDDVTFNFQLQPVYSIENRTRFNMIARAVVPIIGIEPGVVYPPIGSNPAPPSGSTWGISDTILQFFLSPKSDAKWKWGIGPQVSLKTHTTSRVAGPGWGAGIAGVFFGGIGNWSLGSIAMQHWGDDGFSLMTIQPIAMYNFESMPGTYVGYNNAVTFDWNAGSSDSVTLPLGAMFGKTFLLHNGDGLDLSIGYYRVVERPTNAPDSQLKLGISYFFN